MKIIVCAKQVPDTTEVRIDPVTNTMIRAGVPSILNPDDKNALESALLLKDADQDTTVTVISMGPPQAKEMLNECLAMGADEAILLSDRAFGGGDTWATSNVLAAAIRKMGDYDLILAGRQAIDGDTAQVGPQLAERLDLPQVTYVQKFEIEGNKAIVERALEDGHEIIEVNMPVLLTAIKELNEPRYMSVRGIYDNYGEEDKIKVWTIEDLGMDPAMAGLKASPTKVQKSFTPAPGEKGIVLQGNAKEMADDLMIQLKNRHAI